MRVKRGDRVRCVNNDAVSWALTMGAEYIVQAADGCGCFVWLFGDIASIDGMAFNSNRFKPVVRVPWKLGERVA